MKTLRLLLPLGVVFACGQVPVEPVAEDSATTAETRYEVRIPRTDGTTQPAAVMLPIGYTKQGARRPIVIALHGWSSDYTARWRELEQGAMAAGWLYLAPSYRGPNTNADACGSLLAQQDIIDAVRWASDSLPVDPTRIYLAGGSAGGLMALLMAGRYPTLWAAVSAWVPVSDLKAWRHELTTLAAVNGNVPRIQAEIDACTGGLDAEYIARSPVTFLANAKNVPIEIAHGIRDGTPDFTYGPTYIPIRQSFVAFNIIAAATNGTPISARDMAELEATPTARLSHPAASDTVTDLSYGRAIILRRTAGKSRLTIFEGGHEQIGAAAIAWFQRRH